MQLAFLTACLGDRSLDRIAHWAAGNGYDALEIAAWPGHSREHTANHLDVAHLDQRLVDETRALLALHGLGISAISYYDNNLHPDEAERHRVHEHLRACVRAAAELDVGCVGTFVGRDPGKTVSENQHIAARVLTPLTKYAAEHGVALAVENCPMPGWHPDGYPGNLAYSPELWDWMFELGFHLNYDPSHLVWLGIDPVTAISRYGDRIAHVQAKDTQVHHDRIDRYGVYGRATERVDPWDSGWWTYRVPGLGDIDWTRVVDALHVAGYSGAVAVEHEDPVWSGTEDRVLTGLRIARDTLRPMVRP
ncbi:sugar phosphate isomerase/epimerase [Saccharothrix violaceirubra]